MQVKTAKTFQVYIDGVPHEKTFKHTGTFSSGHWAKFNNWAKTTGQATEHIEGDYFGNLAWVTKYGIAEIREVK